MADQKRPVTMLAGTFFIACLDEEAWHRIASALHFAGLVIRRRSAFDRVDDLEIVPDAPPAQAITDKPIINSEI